MMVRFLYYFALVLLSCSSTQAQTLTRVSEVLALDGETAESNPREVQLKGVVLGVSLRMNFFILHDGSGSVGVFHRSQAELKQGDLVQLSGHTIASSVSGASYPRVRAELMQVSGMAELPPATPIPVSAFTWPQHYDQWVSLEGWVMQWSHVARELKLLLVTGSGFVECYANAPDPSSLPLQSHGAKVRLTGCIVSLPQSGRVMFVPSLGQLEVLELGTAEIFEAPQVGIPDIMQRKLEKGKRWRVSGVVAARAEERKLILTSSEGALLAYLLQARGKDEPGVIYGDSGEWPELQPGDEVEVVGSIVDGWDTDSRAYGLTWCYVRKTGAGQVPEPKSMDLEALRSLQGRDEWASVEGIVVGWTLQNHTMLYSVRGERSGFIINVRDAGMVPFPADLHGARLRFTGITRSLVQHNWDTLMVPGPPFVEVIKPGTEDPFEVPTVSAKDVVFGQVRMAERVKVRGQVITRNDDGVVHVRSEGHALRLNLQRPWQRPASSRGMLFADCGDWPSFSLGDEVEVVGSPVTHDPESSRERFDLEESQLRVVEAGDEVKPVETSLEEVAAGAHNADFVQVRGRLLALQQFPVERGEWRTAMLLEHEGVKLPVSFQDKGRANFDTLKVDDEVLVEGIVSRATSLHPRKLRMISEGGAKSLGLSPVVRRSRFFYWGGGLLVALGLLSGWILALRRANRNQLEMANVLEQQVSARTAELEKAKAELHRALDQERELNELKSRFVTTVSHEFRTPLGIIMSAVELMRHYEERLPEEQKKELFEDIHSSTRHMASLMEQVLVLGKVDAGKAGCRRAPLDLDVLLGKLVDEVHSATNRRCLVHSRVLNDISGAVADEALIRHILTNLITNAVKYSPEGQTVEVTAERAGADVIFQVMDQGIGIPEEDQSRLFEAFYRGQNVGETPGTGLGLLIVKRSVDLHGGSIQVQSATGKGTTFTVRVPVF